MAEDLPSFDEMPSFDDMQDQSRDQAQAQPSSDRPLMFDDLPSFDDMQDQSRDQGNAPRSESFAPRVARRVANDAIPAAAGYAGAGAGAEIGGAIGTFVAPGLGTLAGSVIGGGIGALAAGYGAAKIQQAVKEGVGLDDSAQLALNAEEHPYEQFGVGLATNMAGMRPDKAASLIQRGAGAVMGGGLEAGTEYAQEGHIDPAKVAATSAAFAAMPSTNRFGARVEGMGRAAAGKVIPGRPNVAPDAADIPAKDEAQSSEPQSVARGVAFEEPPPNIQGDTIGNPQSRPTVGDVGRDLGKGTAKAENTPDMLTTGDYAPDVAEALQGFKDFKPEGPPNPNDIDQSLRSAPIETGFPTQQAAPPAEQQAPFARPRGQEPAPAAQPVTETRAPEVPVTAAPEAIHPEAQKVADVREDVSKPVSAAQAEAGNYKKGHPGRLFGREVSIETEKGGVREDTKNTPPKWRQENFPYDYGEFLGTKGADGDRVDVGVVGTGDRHFVIDQRDLATGKFDEHKPMVYAKDEADAVDHYVRGFDDPQAARDRIGAVTEVSDEGMRKWLAKPGKKKDPFSPEFKAGEAQAAPAEQAAPVGGKTPKIVTAAVNKMRTAGLPQEAIDRFMALEPSARLGEASRYVNESASVPARPNRIQSRPPEVEGIKNDAGEPVTARDKADAARKSADVAKMNGAYEAFKGRAPDELPTTPEQKKELLEHLQSFLYATKDVKYRPNLKHEPYLLQRAAKKLTTAKNPSDASWQDFIGTYKQLRNGGAADVRAANRTESDIGMNRRSGDDAIAGAEAEQAHSGVNETEDQMIEALDRARQSEGRFDIPHEEAEAMVEPQPVTSAKDLEKIEGASGHIDVTDAAGRKEFAKRLDALPRSKEKGGAVGSVKGPIALEGSENKAGSAVRKIDVSSLPKDYMEKLLAKANKPPSDFARPEAAEQLEKAAASKKPTLSDLADAFLRDNGGALNAEKIQSDLQSAANKIVDGIKWDKLKGRFGRLVDFKHEPYSSYRAREPRGGIERYANQLSDELVTHDNGNVIHKLGLLDWVKQLPKELNNPKTMERVYYTREAGKTNLLPGKEEALYNEHLLPMYKTNDGMADEIEKVAPGLLGPRVENHVYRIAKGDKDLFRPEEDPITGERAIGTAAKGTMLERKYFAFEQKNNGNRFIASKNDDGFTIWHNRKPIQVKDPNFEFTGGGEYKVGSRTYTMKEAMTPEIEQHAMFGPDQKAEYYHNAGLSAAAANYYLGSVLRAINFMGDLRDTLQKRGLAAPPGAKAPEGFVETSLKNFKGRSDFGGWKFDPQVAAVLDRYAQPGFNADGLTWLRELNHAIVGTIFWNPVPHLANVGVHWFGARGFRWLPFSGGYKALAQHGLDAVKSVVNQDGFVKELMDNGASLMYSRTLTKDVMGNLAKGFGEAVQKQPAKWDPIARQFGIGPSDLVRAVYNASSKVMWAGNDMMYVQHVKELMGEGMDMKQAIIATERHIPNYRVPAAVLGSGVGARVFSQILTEPLLTMFGRYHHGVYNSYANIAKDVVHGNGRAKLDAVGNLFAMGLLAFAVYPLLDRAAQWMTGNEHASMQRRGSLGPPSHIAAAVRGEEDPLSVSKTTFPLSPLMTIPIEQMTNRDFRDKPILERGDFQQAAHGDVRAAGRVAVQEGKYLGRTLVAPYNTAMTAADRGMSPGATLRDQVLDIKNPSPKSIKYLGQSTSRNIRSQMQRQRSGSTEESLYNRLTK